MTIEKFYQAIVLRGLDLTEQQKQQLFSYCQLIQSANKVMDLTANDETEEIYEKHFYDSLLCTFSNCFDAKGSLVDVGTGAGFPGVVLAICFPKLQVTLVEPMQKRVQFLHSVIESLSLSNVKVVRMRGEDFAIEHRETFDFATARAVASLAVLVEIILPLLKVDGIFIALKGKKGEEERQEAQRAMKLLSGEMLEIQQETLCTLQEERKNYFIKKKKKTDAKYPRTYAQIKKKPL